MHLADHIRPLLRDHDCVIIPDFGGLVADVSPARAQPGRQALSPPTKLVAFNQALTRNDGLLVDALSQHLGLPIAQAREAVRTAVASLQQELDETNRTELPGIGIFRRATGRGLAFEYTGTDNLLEASFGLPELAARPVRANDTRSNRPQPALRGAATRRSRWERLVPGSIIAVAVSLLLLANYQVALNAGYLPNSLKTQLPRWEWAQRQEAMTAPVSEPQQATLGQHGFSNSSMETEGMTPLEAETATLEPSAQLASKEEVAPELTTPAATPVSATPVVAAPAIITTKPLARETATPVAAVPEVAPAIAAPVRIVATSAGKSSTIIKSPTGRFYVIAGAYSNLKGAETGRANLVHSGHQAHIITPPRGSRLFRLTAADYPDLASAQREAQRLRNSTHCDYNTFKF